MTKRFAILDAQGKVLNVCAFELPVQEFVWPGYGSHWVYADEGARPAPPAKIDPKVTYLGIKAQSHVSPGDTVNLTTGVVTPLTPPVPPPPTKEELKAHAAEKRWEAEIGGIAMEKYRVATDRDSQTKLIAEFVAMVAGIRQEPSVWKMADGNAYALTNAEMQQVCLAARNHIAQVFKIESELIAGIEAGSVTTYADIDKAFSHQ